MGISFINTLLGIWIVIASWLYMPSGTPKILMIITGVLVFAVSLAAGGASAYHFREHHTGHHSTH